MFIENLPSDSALRDVADVCIVGAGAAGIALALELEAKGHDVLLIESGGFRKDAETQMLYSGESIGQPYADLADCRSRYLGGSTNCWAGWCRRLDPIDFERRDWVDNSGWPFAAGTLDADYARAQSLLELGSGLAEKRSLEAASASGKSPFFDLAGSDLVNVLNLLSPPARFGLLYRDALRRSQKIRVLLHANVTEIVCDEAGHRVVAVSLKLRDEAARLVRAKIFVVATGGIENARLLLASRSVHADGIGNGHDLVGRYFMDHPRVRSVRVRLAKGFNRRIYDHSMALVRRRLRLPSPAVAAHVTLSQAAQRSRHVSNSRTYFVSRSFDDLASSSGTLRGWIRSEVRPGRRKRLRQSMNIWSRLLGGLPSNMIDFAQFTFAPRIGWDNFQVETVIEPIPNRDSRVTLLAETDRLGMQKVRLDWRLSAGDRQNYLDSVDGVLSGMEARGMLSRVDPSERFEDSWPGNVQWCWHHMGTTRMHEDSRQGVVDPEGRVHGIHNLFIAGSSVFPTAGSDLPTLTVVALAVRLGRTLARVLSEPMAQIPENPPRAIGTSA